MKPVYTYNEVLTLIDCINPKAYAQTRNYSSGAVTYLSPYISRGIISTQQIFTRLLAKGYAWHTLEKLVQELAWRDYFQRVWQSKGEAINLDLKHVQQPVRTRFLPKRVVEGNTQIQAINRAVKTLYQTGYMHNHSRMYTAMLVCNIAQVHWYKPAKWMYYYLLDADWASNALSWQWVAGVFSSKKYFANQQNINTYTQTHQVNTYLDMDYERLPLLHVPGELQDTSDLELKTSLPSPSSIHIDPSLPTYIYNFYNLDPVWDTGVKANRILLLEPEHFAQYPISENSMQFMLKWAQQIPALQVVVSSFDAFKKHHQPGVVYFKEHPLNTHYNGHEVPRAWLVPNLGGYYPSFFSYWKKIQSPLKKMVYATV